MSVVKHKKKLKGLHIHIVKMHGDTHCTESKKRKYEAVKKNIKNGGVCDKCRGMFASDSDLAMHIPTCQEKTVHTPTNKKVKPMLGNKSSPKLSSPPYKKIKETEEFEMGGDIKMVLNAMKGMEVDEKLDIDVKEEERIPEKLRAILKMKGISLSDHKVRHVGGGGRCGANCISLHTIGTEEMAAEIISYKNILLKTGSIY